MTTKSTHKRKRTMPIAMATILLAAAVVPAAAADPDPQAEQFNALCRQAQKDPAGTSPQQIKQLVSLGREVGKPYAVSLSLKSYLARNLNPAPEILLMAAENALETGDYTAAVSRYRGYLEGAAKDGRTSAGDSRAAARLYGVLIDFVGSADGAYQFIDRYGTNFRQTPEARRFDGWFIDLARRRNDYAAVAKYLAAVLATKYPLEQERYYFWPELDWLAGQIREPAPEKFAAIPHCRKIVPLIRGDKRRQMRFALDLAYLEYAANSAGKDPAELDKLFAPVIQAAKNYVDALPSFETCHDIFMSFGQVNGSFNGNRWNEQVEQKREFFGYAFEKLSNADRVKLLGWHNYLATPEQWVEIAAKHAKLFRTTHRTRNMPFVPIAEDPALYKKQTTFLAGVPSQNAAAINSLAAGGELSQSFQHLLANESWHLGFGQFRDVIYNQMWEAYRHYPRDEENALADDYFGKAIVDFGARAVNTPLFLFDTATASSYVTYAFRHGGKDENNKSHISGVLASLQWMPYNETQRQQVFGGAYNEFKSWADAVRKTLESAKNAADANAKAIEENEKAIAENTKVLNEARQQKAELQKQAAQLDQVNKQIAQLEAQAKQLAGQDQNDANVKKAVAANAQAMKEAQAQKQNLTKAVAGTDAVDKQIAQLQETAKTLNETKKELDAKKTELAAELEKAQTVAAQLTTLETAFQQAMDPKSTDVNQAPDALTKDLAIAQIAIDNKNAEQFVTAARRLYQKVRTYEASKTPFGRATMDFIMASRDGTIDTFDFQMEVAADQLKTWAPNISDWSQWRLVEAIDPIRRRSSWRESWQHIPNDQLERAQKLNDVMSAALIAQIDKGQLWDWLFDRYRNTRWGRWSMNVEVMEKLIEKKTLLSHPYRPTGYPSATANYMWFLESNRWAGLKEKYPTANYFDDLFVEEANKTQYLDTNYWRWGKDTEKKVRNAAAKILTGFEGMPLGYGDDPVEYSRGDYYSWQSHATNADQELARALIDKIESDYGKTRFDAWAMGYHYFTHRAEVETPEGRAEFFQKLKTYIDRASNSPSRTSPPPLNQLANLKGKRGEPLLSEQELNVLLSIFPDCVPSNWGNAGYDTLVRLIQQGLDDYGRMGDLYRLTPHLWKIARDTGDSNLQRQMIDFARNLMDEERYSLATAYSTAGMEILGNMLPEAYRTNLMLVRSKSLLEVGGVVMVDRSDPRYPMFAAQAAFLTGRHQSAWEQYLAHRSMAAGMIKDLDPEFVLWLIGRNIENENYDTAEALARQMMQWVDSTPAGFESEVKARLLVLYADIAFAKQEYPIAKSQYQRIASAAEYDGTLAQRDAQLKMAEVERMQKNYDLAIDRLERLARKPDRYLQTQAQYQLALVKFDQEEYRAAADELEQVFALAPDHAEGRILQGKLFLKLKQLMQATDLAIGLATSQEYIVPGRPFKVRLEDRNLSVVGKSTDVEIRVWTDGGDEEFFSLLPFGDSKTKFEGQVNTVLAPIKKGDHVLQVLGGDTVRYDYSPKFRRSNKISEGEPSVLRVVTDSELYIGSGRILTKEERDAQALERMIRHRLQMDDQTAADHAALSTVRAGNEVKPGNKINVRVVDPDRSVTDKADTLNVSVATTSGDRIAAFPLTETETHSGVFEGAVPTSSGQAVAYASDSKESTEPSFAISGGEYPAWVALPDSVRPKLFTIDINDNIALGRMTVLSDVTGRHIESFTVQTSLNGQEFETVGAWPEQYEPWDGALTLEMVRFGSAQRAPSGMGAYEGYLGIGHLRDNLPKVARKVENIAANWNANPAGLGGNIGLQANGPGSWYIAHFKGAFYVPRRQVRTFMLDHKNKLGNINYVLAIDGEVNPESPFRIKRSLSKGVHRIDLYIGAQRNADPTFELLCDSDEPPYMVPCPPEMFDIEAHPEIRDAVHQEPAQVAANEQGTEFNIDFADGTRTRIVRLVLTDFETDAPAIRRIALTDKNGQKVLPTAQDFMKLRENDNLEVVPGDRITVTYEDPSIITRNRDTLEAFMTATFHNAEVSASFVEYNLNREGVRVPRYIPLRRFKVGDAFTVFIRDPDGDVSDERDTLSFTARTYETEPVELQAMETGPHSGVFTANIVPISGQPERKIEIPVREGEDIMISYMDRENTDPGIPWARTAQIEQVWYQDPELRVYSYESEPLPEEQIAAAAARAEEVRHLEEYVPTRRTLIAERPEQADGGEPATLVLGCPLLVELEWPTIAQSPLSSATLFVQTASGRRVFEKELADDEFDVNVPGTIRLAANPGEISGVGAPPGYNRVVVLQDKYASTPLDDGRFVFRVHAELGALPRTSLIDEQFEGMARKTTLNVQGEDEIFVGMKYEDDEGAEHWLVRRIELTSDPLFDVMDRRYQQVVDNIHVGEVAYLRLIHPSRDTTDGKDVVSVRLRSSSGREADIELMETFGHSGIFKGLVKLVFADDADALEQVGAFGVEYGDSVTLTYPLGDETGPTRKLAIFKGADGEVIPFTKQFRDKEIAVQTQFTIAEAYFELAKRHRDLGQEELARREIAQGKKLLEEALADYPNTESRAQAEYLLANLAFEFAKDAEDEETRKRFYMEAATRFSDIVASYPESTYAPKSQYKKAQVFEKMGMIDEASEEYVKLSYRYPDNELVAQTIARLGQYFLAKGKEMEAEMKQASDPVEREKIKLQSNEMFKTAAEVFGRLAVRFPDHELGGKTTVLSAQCYMQADELGKAVEVFGEIIEDPNADKDLIAESMFWRGECYLKQEDLINAYRMYKRLTWDYPASDWAKYARGRLTDPDIAEVGEKDIEIR